jgi:ribosome biogenesis GTPase A
MGMTQKKSGFWAERQQTLKISKLKNWKLCARCKTLKQHDEKGYNGRRGGGAKHVNALQLLQVNSQMVEIFRRQVSKIRSVEKAVVVLCVDAINVTGTLMRTIRNYVGGNPILLAVTRCDLLPDYVLEQSQHDKNVMRHVFMERAKELKPADVILCSIPLDADSTQDTLGVEQLANDLFEHLNGRDTYVIGAANIGKSTLTDMLVFGLMTRGTQSGHFKGYMEQKRMQKLREARVTKSALPGTTLQNVRVPCFVNHLQALWDTPGLVLDHSQHHFPIRNIQQLLAERPTQIQPLIFEVPETTKSFALLISEKGGHDELPLLRFEVRLRKDGVNPDGEPVRLVWNSTFPLNAKVVDIMEARKDEKERRTLWENKMEQERALDRQKKPTTEEVEQEPNKRREDRPLVTTTEEEKAQRRAERRQAFQEKVRQEKMELGNAEWHRREKEREAQRAEDRRSKVLAELSEVAPAVICDGGYGTDICVANFGWLGFLAPVKVKIVAFAPSTGVKVSSHPTLSLPISWGEFQRATMDDEEKDDEAEGEYGDGDGDSDDSDDDDDDDDGWGYIDDGWGYEDDVTMDFETSRNDDDFDDDDEEFEPKEYKMSRRSFQRTTTTNQKPDPWEKYSGKHVGWQFYGDMRWSRERCKKGGIQFPKKRSRMSLEQNTAA